MDALADVNIPFALVNSRHSFHVRACEWLDSQPSGFCLAICRHVQMALIRLLSNHAAMVGDPLTLPASWKVYADLISDPAMAFLPEPSGISQTWIELCQPYGASPKVLSDAYLASIAITLNIPLVTFDKDFRQFKGLTVTLLKGK